MQISQLRIITTPVSVETVVKVKEQIGDYFRIIMHKHADQTWGETLSVWSNGQPDETVLSAPSLPPSPHRLNPEGDFIYGVTLVTRIVKVRTHSSLTPSQYRGLQQKPCLSHFPDRRGKSSTDTDWTISPAPAGNWILNSQLSADQMQERDVRSQTSQGQDETVTPLSPDGCSEKTNIVRLAWPAPQFCPHNQPLRLSLPSDISKSSC